MCSNYSRETRRKLSRTYKYECSHSGEKRETSCSPGRIQFHTRPLYFFTTQIGYFWGRADIFMFFFLSIALLYHLALFSLSCVCSLVSHLTHYSFLEDKNLPYKVIHRFEVRKSLLSHFHSTHSLSSMFHVGHNDFDFKSPVCVFYLKTNLTLVPMLIL